MGTILFWMAWAMLACFYTVTTRKQRQQWFWLMWLLTVGMIVTASILNATRQGYLTYL